MKNVTLQINNKCMSSSDVFTPIIFFLFDELGVGKLGRVCVLYLAQVETINSKESYTHVFVHIYLHLNF